MGINPHALYSMVELDLLPYFVVSRPGDNKVGPDISPREFACHALMNSIIKKWSETSEHADQFAEEKFRQSNEECRNWSLRVEWESDSYLLGEFHKELDMFFHRPNGSLLFTYSDIVSGGRVGPGASIGANGGHMYAKLFSSPMWTTSDSLYKMYRAYVALFSEFSNAENIRRENYGDRHICNYSRCSFVPKTTDISRMICVEPNLNMFFQLGLGAIMEERMIDQFGIDLSTQPDINRLLARIGSEDGSFATIDLSSASDSISLSMLRRFLPPYVFDTLMELRSPNTLIESELVSLNMVSTMGNGFTFPLQTIIFSCLIRAAYTVADIPCGMANAASPNWACFGDDLIVRTEAFRNVSRLLSLLGFKENSSKTFFEGRFRESCGTDWFDGQNVRGVYLRKLRSPQDIFVAINLLNEWSARTGVPLRGTIQFLLKFLPKDSILYVPFSENHECGIRVPFIFLSELQLVRRDANKTVMYKRMEPRKHVVRFEDGIIHIPRGSKKLIYNPSGLMLSFLHGELVGGSISIRNDRARFRPKLACIPWWDFMPKVVSSIGREFTWRQWETAAMKNLSS